MYRFQIKMRVNFDDKEFFIYFLEWFFFFENDFNDKDLDCYYTKQINKKDYDKLEIMYEIRFTSKNLSF